MASLLKSYWFIAAFFSIAQKFAITLFGLLSYLMLIRIVSVEFMSYWGIFLSIVSIFESVKTNLIKNAFIKYSVQARKYSDEMEVYSSAFALNLALSVVFFLIVVLFSEAIGTLFNSKEILPGLLYWYLPGVLFQTFFSHFEFLNQAKYNFKNIFYGYFIKQAFFLLSIAVVFFFYKGEIDLRYISFAQSCSILFGCIAMYFSTGRFHFSLVSVKRKTIKNLLSYGKYIFGSGLMATLFANVDQILTASVLSSKSIAYYNAASKINALVDVPSYAAAEIAFPRLAKADEFEGREKVRYLYERMVGVLMAITLPLSVLIFIFPTIIIRVIAGAEYFPAAIILQIYMLTSLLRPMQNQAANVLNSIGRESLCFYVNLFSLVVNLGINYLLIKMIGFYGAAYGTLISFVLGCTFWYFMMRKILGIRILSIFNSIFQTYRFMLSKTLDFLKGIRAKVKS